MDVKTESASAPVMATITSSSGEAAQGNRSCSCKMFLLYLFAVLVGIAGVIVLVASPKSCPTDYEEKECLSCSDGCQTYDCTSDDGDTCSDKRISGGAIAGGVILLVTSLVMLISSCCFQCRCCCKNANF